jgi:hypothetical protein
MDDEAAAAALGVVVTAESPGAMNGDGGGGVALGVACGSAPGLEEVERQAKSNRRAARRMTG